MELIIEYCHEKYICPNMPPKIYTVDNDRCKKLDELWSSEFRRTNIMDGCSYDIILGKIFHMANIDIFSDDFSDDQIQNLLCFYVYFRYRNAMYYFPSGDEYKIIEDDILCIMLLIFDNLVNGENKKVHAETLSIGYDKLESELDSRAICGYFDKLLGERCGVPEYHCKSVFYTSRLSINLFPWS